VGTSDAARAPRPDYPQVGDRLRARRTELGRSLRDVADRLGVSPSLISQIERGLANPSVSTLYALVGELDLSLDELLFPDRRPAGQSDASGGPIQRAGDRQSIRLASGVLWQRLTTRSEPDAEFLHVTYDVGGASSPADTYQRHAGHEWGYVISGSLRVTIGFREYLLGPGDAVSVDSMTPHRLENAGDVPVEAIWFVVGRDGHGAPFRGIVVDEDPD
jgi:transcriptional regulator with XRE-family HTH domain